MRLLIEPSKYTDKNVIGKDWREYQALFATALDAEKHPALAATYDGIMRLGDALFLNDHSPLVSKYGTVPCGSFA